MKNYLFFVFAIFMIYILSAGVMAMDNTEYFDKNEFEKVPCVYPCDVPVQGNRAWKYEGILTKEEEREADKGNNYIKPIFYDGPDCKGKKTRVFAWIGVPPCEDGKKVPAMVLVHGGGGTAFEAWVRLWNARGYAAIAMDTCGCVPVGEYGKWLEHAWSGHTSWGHPDRIDEPIKDQWPYQAVMEVLLGTSLLASYPQVDENRMGITGISWGGWLTCICAGVDKRFVFANPIYGCGHIEYSIYHELDDYKDTPYERYKKWIEMWDPSHFLKNVSKPIHFFVGCNDHAFWPRSQKASFEECADFAYMHLKREFIHDHGEHGECQKESEVIADYYLKGGEKWTDVRTDVSDGRISFETDRPIKKAVLMWTEEDCPHPLTDWKEINIDLKKKSIEVPKEARVYFVNITDERDLLTSGTIYAKNELTEEFLTRFKTVACADKDWAKHTLAQIEM